MNGQPVAMDWSCGKPHGTASGRHQHADPSEWGDHGADAAAVSSAPPRRDGGSISTVVAPLRRICVLVPSTRCSMRLAAAPVHRNGLTVHVDVDCCFKADTSWPG